MRNATSLINTLKFFHNFTHLTVFRVSCVSLIFIKQSGCNQCQQKISEVAIVQQLIFEFCGQQVFFTLDALHCQKKQLCFVLKSLLNGGNPRTQLLTF